MEMESGEVELVDGDYLDVDTNGGGGGGGGGYLLCTNDSITNITISSIFCQKNFNFTYPGTNVSIYITLLSPNTYLPNLSQLKKGPCSSSSRTRRGLKLKLELLS